MTPIVVSLSTIPPRFAQVGATLRTLLDQSVRPDRIELWIPRTYRRFPDHAFRLPDVPEGVTIEVTDDDLGPATKILPCARKYRGTATRILYVDDDRIYWRHLLKTRLAAAERRPGAAIAAVGCDVDFFWQCFVLRDFRDRPCPKDGPVHQPRVERRRGGLRNLPRNLPYWIWREVAFARQKGPGWMIWPPDCGYADIAEGFGGVLVEPAMFEDAAFAIPPVLWAVDDLWLSGCLAVRDIPIWVEKTIGKGGQERNTVGTAVDALTHATLDGHSRPEANRAAIRYFREQHGIWL